MSSFFAAFSKINKAIITSKKQALKQAGNSTKTLITKTVKSELGIKSDVAKRRLKLFKATEQSITLSVGTRVELAARHFKPGQYKVSTRVGTRYAATYTVNGSKASLPKGAFLANVNTLDETKKLVLTRTGDARFPVKTVTVPLLIPVIEKNLDMFQKHMSESFERNLRANIKYNMDKK
jgi:hypothetical protein